VPEHEVRDRWLLAGCERHRQRGRRPGLRRGWDTHPGVARAAGGRRRGLRQPGPGPGAVDHVQPELRVEGRGVLQLRRSDLRAPRHHLGQPLQLPEQRHHPERRPVRGGQGRTAPLGEDCTDLADQLRTGRRPRRSWRGTWVGSTTVTAAVVARRAEPGPERSCPHPWAHRRRSEDPGKRPARAALPGLRVLCPCCRAGDGDDGGRPTPEGAP